MFSENDQLLSGEGMLMPLEDLTPAKVEQVRTICAEYINCVQQRAMATWEPLVRAHKIEDDTGECTPEYLDKILLAARMHRLIAHIDPCDLSADLVKILPGLIHYYAQSLDFSKLVLEHVEKLKKK